MVREEIKIGEKTAQEIKIISIISEICLTKKIVFNKD